MIGGRIIVVLSLVLSPVLTIPAPYQPRANWTGHIQPKQEIRARNILDNGYHVLAVGEWAIVTSPGYPGNYQNNADMHWKIVSADWKTGYLEVWCHNHMFHIQNSWNCHADQLNIKFSFFHQRYCGPKKPLGYFRTTQNWIDFHFKSDGSGNAAGFLCQIKAMGSPFVPSNCYCGYANTNRIENGEPSQPNEFPWLAALVKYGTTRPICGGTLYNTQWVITAAHCVKQQSDPNAWQVLLGMYNWETQDPTPIRHSVSKIIPHEQFGIRATMDSDIALMKLSTPVAYSNRVRPVCLPRTIVNFAGHNSYTTGWGQLSIDQEGPKMAYKVEYPIRTHQECLDNYYDHNITNNMICAGFDKFDKNVCPGDSGGPLTVDMWGRHYLVGVVSFTDICSVQRYYDGFTYVPNYMSFIISNAGDQCP